LLQLVAGQVVASADSPARDQLFGGGAEGDKFNAQSDFCSSEFAETEKAFSTL
jgi:hypothetical protein